MKTLEHFVEQQLSNGRFSFSTTMLKDVFDKSDKALKQSLYRLKAKGKIAHVRSGFYMIIPPEYSQFGMIPPDLFIDDLMKCLGKKYYVGLFSSASLQGASHQAVMQYYVITNHPPLRSVNNAKMVINFYSKKEWQRELILQRKTDAGYINISCPELTTFDLLNYGNFSLNRIATILEELYEFYNAKRLKLSVKQASTASIQRLGYLLDQVVVDNVYSEVLQQELTQRRLFPVLLSKRSSHQGKADKSWNVIINTDIESDL
ncbi:MAG: hypothetical protein KDC37_03860 [Flavobacteriales bacterium]|nr:hypothetical protein [Flavobacteriales bacterium]